MSWPRLHPDALVGLPGEVVDTIGPHTEADPVALLGTYLAMLGNAAGPSPHFMVGRNPHRARLNVALVGRTARARKGQSFAEVRSIFTDADPAWAEARIMSGLASGEGLIHAVRDPDEDGSGGVGDKRLLVTEPEFVRVLKACQRDGNTLSAVIREAWDDGRLRVLTRRDPLVASSSHISLCTHVTPDELRRHLGGIEASNGFANRFLFLCVERARILPTGGNLSDDEVRHLADRTRSALAAARKFGRMRRSDDAEVLWADMYRQIAEDEPAGLVGAITARAEAQLLRVAMVYALSDSSPVIEPEHLRAAWAVVTFAQDSAEHLFADTSGDPLIERVFTIVNNAGPSGIARADITRDLSGHVHGGELDAVLAALEKANRIYMQTQPTAGRPRTVVYSQEAAP